MRAQQYNFYYYSMCNFLCCKNKPFLLSMMTTSIYLYTYIQHKLFASPHENVIYNWHKMSIIQHLVTHYVSPPLLFPHLTKCKFTTITLYHKPSKMGKTQAVIPTPHQWYFHHWCCGPAHSAWTNIIHTSFFDNHRSTWDNLFFFFSWSHKLSDPYLQNVGHISFLGILLTMWEPRWPLFLWKRPCHTHISFFPFFGGGTRISVLHTLSYKGGSDL